VSQVYNSDRVISVHSVHVQQFFFFVSKKKKKIKFFFFFFLPVRHKTLCGVALCAHPRPHFSFFHRSFFELTTSYYYCSALFRHPARASFSAMICPRSACGPQTCARGRRRRPSPQRRPPWQTRRSPACQRCFFARRDNDRRVRENMARSLVQKSADLARK
jgi:hypothetical protein